MMNSTVFWTPIENSDTVEKAGSKLARLIGTSRLMLAIAKKDLVAVKLHFGEEGNTGYVLPRYLRVICDHIAQREARPFLSDTNTLYKGKRTTSPEHIQLAYDHGFTPENTNAELDIPDDTVKENTVSVRVDRSFIREAKISLPYMRADALVGVAHFKGHMLTGFGGALKNIGMGCATREGKLAQHSGMAPVIAAKRCDGCLSCMQVCPPRAITVKDGKAVIDSEKCIGCAHCIAECRLYAIQVDWEAQGAQVPKKMVEYAEAVLKAKKGKSFFFNFATHITAECDCMAGNGPPISSDVGIFASADPVALDKASYDLVVRKAGRDVFREAHPAIDGLKQLEYAAELGLGSLEYGLVEV